MTSANSEMIRLSDLCRKQAQEIVDLRRYFECAHHRNEMDQMRILKLINDDTFSASFQTMGQYRTALMREISEIAKKPNTDRKP